MRCGIYLERYEELLSTYRIAYSVPANPEDKKLYDIIVECVQTEPGFSKYRIARNKPKVSNKDLAIICADGNLDFGYHIDGSLIVVYKA